MTTKMTPTIWRAEQAAQFRAGQQADALIRRLGLSYPIDPLQVAMDEWPRLRAGGKNFANRFDGKLKYVNKNRCFVLMYNTKYDVGLSDGAHHPRTRFSIAHELGHYFIEHHHAYLTQGGKAHASINEFRCKLKIEREADAFAANLLLPSHQIKPVINSGELSVRRLEQIAGDFQTSLVSTAIRSVQLSHFPCALAGIREGAVMWMFPSATLIDAGIYTKRGGLPRNAAQPWAEFQVGAGKRSENEGRVRDWFTTHGDLDSVYVTEEYIPIQSMGTLLVLLTMDESDLFADDESDDI